MILVPKILEDESRFSEQISVSNEKGLTKLLALDIRKLLKKIC